MSSAVLDENEMATGKNTERERIDLRVEPALVARIKHQAERLGIGLSAYIRQAVSLKLEEDEAEEVSRGRPRKGK